jgi:hypothetical protein
VVELLRHSHTLSIQNRTAINRWLFLRKLTTRLRLEHLWHDLKSSLDNGKNNDQELTSDLPPLSRRHLSLWNICMCMGSRVFHGLIFDKLHQGEDISGHWTPYFGRYMQHLDVLEEAATSDHSSEPADSSYEHESQLAMLWLYFMGAAVEVLVFRKTRGTSTGNRICAQESSSCIDRFRRTYAELNLGPDDVVAVFAEDLLFSSDVLQDLFDQLVQP